MPHKNKNKNKNENANASPRGGGGGGRPFRGGRGHGRGGGRGGRGHGGGGGGGFVNAQAQLASEMDMLNDFVIAPPSPERLGSPYRGRGRGRGGGVGRGRGQGGFVGDSEFNQGGRGRGRGRGGYAGRGRGGGVPGGGSAMLQDDLQVMGRMFAAEEQVNQQGNYASVLFPSRGTPRGGGRGGRGRGALPTNDAPGHRRTSGIGAGAAPNSPQASRGNFNSNYRPVDPFGPLSSLLHRERPLLRPIIFVPSVHTKVLFSCDDEEEARDVEAEVKEEVLHVENVDELDGGVEARADGVPRGEFAAHAPTADRVMRVFMGSPIPSDESSSSEDEGEGGNDDMEDIEEIDFSDLSKLMEVDMKKTRKAKVDTKTKLWMEQGAGEESFLGTRATPVPQEVGLEAKIGLAGEAKKVIESVTAKSSTTTMTATTSILKATTATATDGGDRDQEKIVVAIDEMHIDGHTREVYMGTTSKNAADAAPTPSKSNLPAAAADVPTPGDTQVQHRVEEVALDFVIDTEPVHVRTHEKPRIRTPPPMRLDDDDDDEVIVYVAPHPRRSEVKQAAKAQAPKPDPSDHQHIFTPYEGARGTTSTSVVEAAPTTTTTTTTFPTLGTPRVSKRLAAPALSTPRMAKQALAKQKRVAKREKDAERRRKARSSLQGMFDKKRKGRGGFGAIGAMMQERELQDEYGSGSEDGDGVDRKWKERRRGDSDLEWGTDDEDAQSQVPGRKGGVDDDEYMTLPQLQQVLMESAAAGRTNGGDGGQGEFTPYTPPASSKRKERRRKSGANANAGSAAQRRKDESIATAMEMDVDSDLEVEAMKQFAGGMLGRDGGVHVTFGDLEDEQRMREEDADLGGGVTDSGDNEGESEEVGEEEKEMQRAVDLAEELLVAEDLAELSIEDDDDDDDEGDDDGEDDEEKTPRSSFAARLQKLRESAKKPRGSVEGKGKGKAKMGSDEDEMDFDDDDEDDDDEDDYFKRDIQWSMEDDEKDLINKIQGLLDANEELMSGRDRKQSKKLFKAISNGEFDYFDEDFYFPQAKRGKKAQRDAIPPTLRAQWDKDREAKAERKKQRELEKLFQAADPFSIKGGNKGRKAMLAAARLDPTITVVPNRIIDMTTLVQMLHKFVDDLGGKQTLNLPPTNKETRKNVHQLALAFGLKSLSKGKGDARYVTVTKTTRTGPGRVDERKVARIMKKSGAPGARGNDFMSGANPYKGAGGKGQVPKHKEGDVVGKAAPKIDASNVGFKMLAMMGWTEGERIGVGGLEAPIEAVIKHSKLGLGAMK